MLDFDTKYVGDLGKLIVAKGFKKSPKVQKIAQSGHTEALSGYVSGRYLQNCILQVSF